MMPTKETQGWNNSSCFNEMWWAVLIFNTLSAEGLKIPKRTQPGRNPCSHDQPGGCVGKAGITQHCWCQGQLTGPKSAFLGLWAGHCHAGMQSAVEMPNHCSATVKKQKQLQGITGSGALAEIITACILTSSTRNRKEKEKMTFMYVLNTKHCLQLREAPSCELLQTKWQLPCSSTSVLLISHRDTTLAKRTSAWPGGVLSFILPLFIFFSLELETLKLHCNSKWRQKTAMIP